jgi:hypothetical protein
MKNEILSSKDTEEDPACRVTSVNRVWFSPLNSAIVFLFLLLLFPTIFLFSQGLGIGSGVTYSREGIRFSGTVSKLTIGEKEALTTLAQNGKPVKLFMREIQRIERTGEKWKVTPSWSYTESSYQVFRFTWMNGQSQLLAIYQWPVWDISLSDGSQAANLWLEKLDWIEMGTTAVSTNSGLAVNAQVQYKLNDEIITGNITGIAGSLTKSPVTCMTEKGTRITLMLKDISSITRLNKTARITPSWSYTQSTYQLFEVVRTTGQTIILAFAEWPIFDIAATDGSTRNSQWLDKMEYIRVL